MEKPRGNLEVVTDSHKRPKGAALEHSLIETTQKEKHRGKVGTEAMENAGGANPKLQTSAAPMGRRKNERQGSGQRASGKRRGKSYTVIHRAAAGGESGEGNDLAHGISRVACRERVPTDREGEGGNAEEETTNSSEAVRLGPMHRDAARPQQWQRPPLLNAYATAEERELQCLTQARRRSRTLTGLRTTPLERACAWVWSKASTIVAPMIQYGSYICWQAPTRTTKRTAPEQEHNPGIVIL